MRERLRDRWVQAEQIQRRLVVATVALLFWIVLAAIKEDDERTWALWAVGFAFGAFALAGWAAVDAAKRNTLAEQEAAWIIGLLQSIDRRLPEAPRPPEDEPGAPNPPGLIARPRWAQTRGKKVRETSPLVMGRWSRADRGRPPATC